MAAVRVSISPGCLLRHSSIDATQSSSTRMFSGLSFERPGGRPTFFGISVILVLTSSINTEYTRINERARGKGRGGYEGMDHEIRAHQWHSGS